MSLQQQMASAMKGCSERSIHWGWETCDRLAAPGQAAGMTAAALLASGLRLLRKPAGREGRDSGESAAV